MGQQRIPVPPPLPLDPPLVARYNYILSKLHILSICAWFLTSFDSSILLVSLLALCLEVKYPILAVVRPLKLIRWAAWVTVLGLCMHVAILEALSFQSGAKADIFLSFFFIPSPSPFVLRLVRLKSRYRKIMTTLIALIPHLTRYTLPTGCNFT